MSSVARYRQYAADCVRQAQSENTTDEKNILLNVAMAWLRLAQQTQALSESETDSPPAAPEESERHEAHS